MPWVVGEAGTGQVGDGQRQRAATLSVLTVYMCLPDEPFVLEDRLARAGVVCVGMVCHRGRIWRVRPPGMTAPHWNIIRYSLENINFF